LAKPPELGQLTRREIAELVGAAPLKLDHGTMRAARYNLNSWLDTEGALPWVNRSERVLEGARDLLDRERFKGAGAHDGDSPERTPSCRIGWSEDNDAARAGRGGQM